MYITKFQETGVINLTQEDLDDPGTMRVVDRLLEQQHDSFQERIDTIGDQLELSDGWATAIWYLRTRSRWCQEYEDRLIAMARAGEDTPNMNEWPPDYFGEPK